MELHNNEKCVIITISIFLLFISHSHTSSEVDKFNSLTVTDDSFIGAVIEYGGIYNGIGKEQVMYNLEQYIQIVYDVMSKVPNISIIVFPEVGLQMTHGPSSADIYGEPVPDKIGSISPCYSNDTMILKTLSCLAMEYNTYIVANLIESAAKTNSTEIDYYNTNVIFDRNGSIIARYRKFNVYGIDGKPLKKPTTPDFTYFDTDFGVRFGTFTCFDIAFQTPALDLIHKHNITHFVFPVGWVSELPFLTALQMQAGWARANNVVLLAAGLNDPSTGSTGSGIYAGKNIIGAYQTSSSNNFAVVGVIPKKLTEYSAQDITSITLSLNSTKEDTDILELLEDKTDVYRGALLVENSDYRKGEGAIGLATRWSRTEVKDKKVCYGDFCCKFSLNFTVQYMDSLIPHKETISSGDHFGSNEYMLVAFDGVRSYGGGIATGGIKLCAVISCLNRNATSCGQSTYNSSPKTVVFNSIRSFYKIHTIFHNIIVETEILTDRNDIFVMPDAFSRHESLSDPITGNEFGNIENSYEFENNFDPDRSTTNVKISTMSEITDLGAFGIYARVFSKDGSPATSNISYIDYDDIITENGASEPTLLLTTVLISLSLFLYNKIS